MFKFITFFEMESLFSITTFFYLRPLLDYTVTDFFMSINQQNKLTIKK